MSRNLLFLAGHRAYERIRSQGLSADDVRMVVGASGAAKRLVLHGLESAVFGIWFSGRAKTLHLYGTSIGSWKSAAAAQGNPQEGFDRLAHAYILQRYEGGITPDSIACEVKRITDAFLPDGKPEEILRHPYCRLHFSAVRCRGLLASDKRGRQTAGLIFAWLANRISRNLYRRMCLPTLFYDPRTPPPFLANREFPGGAFPLSGENFKEALIASGSISCIMKSVRRIPEVRSGAYRDGGLYHYHPAFDFLMEGEGIVLYPHFYDRVTLGWFDKKLPSRMANGKILADVLLLAPSPSFVADLPHGRIPDRRDFARFAGRDKERISFWEKAVAMSRKLGEEFLEAVDSGKIKELVSRIS